MVVICEAAQTTVCDSGWLVYLSSSQTFGWWIGSIRTFTGCITASTASKYRCSYNGQISTCHTHNWCLRRILDIRWYHRVSNWEVRHLTEQPLLTSIIQKRRLMLFGHPIRMDESADAMRILTAVPQSDWRRPVGRPHSSWMATLKNDLSLHNLTYEDAIEMALDKPLWGLLAASGAMHWWCMPNNDDDDDSTHTPSFSK